MITITYNSDKTLKDTFDSVLIQTHRPLQYVVVDGASTDRTVDIIKAYEPIFKAAGIEYSWKSEKDHGISDAFNRGISQVTGEIVGIINSDDKLAENALIHLSEEYRSDIGVYYGKCLIFNNESDKSFIAIPKFQKNERLLESGMALYHPSTFITKKTYDLYGTYDTELKMCMDRELLLRFYKKGVRFKYVDIPLAYYREGGTNQANYKKTAVENESISVKYGMNVFEAKIRRIVFKVHDYLWKLIQKIQLEKVFHKEA